MNHIIPHNSPTLPIAMSALIAASTSLALAPTLAAECVGLVCKLGLVADAPSVSIPTPDDAVPSNVPFPARVLVADDTAFVVALVFMPVGLAFSTATPELAAQLFASAPRFSSKLPIWVPESAKKQRPAPIGRPSASEQETSQ